MSLGIAFWQPTVVLPATTWNPADKAASIDLSGGNLIASMHAGVAAPQTVRATNGKLNSANGYFEVVINASFSGANYCMIGLATSAASLTTFLGTDAFAWAYYQQTGDVHTNNVYSPYGTTYAQGDIVGVAFKNGSLWFSKNNVWQNSGNPSGNTGAAFTGITGTLFPAITIYNGTAVPTDVFTGHFSSGALTYSPPAGFTAWG